MEIVFENTSIIDICTEKEFEKATGNKLSNNEDKFEIVLDEFKTKSSNRGTGVLIKNDIKTSNKFINATQSSIKEHDKEELSRICNADVEFPYRKINILTNAELQLYNFMKNNLSQVERISIFPKVRLADIIEVDNKITNDNKYLWKITNKHVDYLICEANTLDVICVVELDDYTHETDKAQERDQFVMTALDTCGIKTLRVKKRIRDIEKSDLDLIDECINMYLAPKCSNCGLEMRPKKAKDGHKFYACIDFINCRNTLDIEPRGERLP